MVDDIIDTLKASLPRHMMIDGERVGAQRGGYMPTFDPATARHLVDVPAGTSEDADRAVAAAKNALRGPWRALHPSERGRILHRVADIIRRDSEHLAQVETLNCGKPLGQAKSDIEKSAKYFEYYAGTADKLEGNTLPAGPDYMSLTFHEPVGVTAHIVPWNYPISITARGIAPALACGNTVVLKPDEKTPLTAILLADILEEAGLPTGVVNVITGTGEELGAPLSAHPDVGHVTFTGSVESGKTVMTAASSHIASVTLELGGKSPVIVLEDADVDVAVAEVIRAIYTNSGQTCAAGSRLVVDRKLHARMLEGLVAKSKTLRLGHGLCNPDLGPLISREQFNRVAGYVDGARKRGVSIAVGGGAATVPGLEGGAFFEPTVLDMVSPQDIVAQDEIFGPVLAVQVVDSAEEALTVANNSRYGLVAAIFTRSINRALTLARDLDVGQVFVNEYFSGGVATPFGGVKESGFGREKGLASLSNYYRVKSVSVRI